MFYNIEGAQGTYVSLREQARVQLQARETNQAVYETLEIHEGVGLTRLPEPTQGDIFLDFESDPFAGTGGMEYLFGWQLAEEPEDAYHCRWALNAQAEKDAFVTFIGVVMQRLEQYPGLHIYHFAPFEEVALKRLMTKYKVCETEVDHILRAGILIDLHSITKQALRAGIESYSLKELEIFHAFERKMELRQASLQLRVIERHLERNQADQIPDEAKKAVELYNLEDCLSASRLRAWLEYLRSEFIGNGIDIPRPPERDGKASEALSEHQQAIQRLSQQLTEGISLNRGERTNEEQAVWLLANMLDWHRQENKSKWWEYFRLIELPQEELTDEKTALAGLEFTGSREQIKKSVGDVYRFPSQDSDIKPGDKLRSETGNNFGEVVEIDLESNTVKIKKGPAIADQHPVSVFAFDIISDDNKPAALWKLATWVAENGIGSEQPEHRSARDLLLHLAPRLNNEPEGFKTPQEKALSWVKCLAHGVLPIQGPPCAGKSHTAANMIIELILAGKKVGVTALGHKVIRELLNKVFLTAAERGVILNAIQKLSQETDNPPAGLTETKDNGAVRSALSGGAQLAAGTSYLWWLLHNGCQFKARSLDKSSLIGLLAE